MTAHEPLAPAQSPEGQEFRPDAPATWRERPDAGNYGRMTDGNSMRKRLLQSKLVVLVVLLTGCTTPNPRVDREDALGASTTALPPAPEPGELAVLLGTPRAIYVEPDPAARAPRDLDVADAGTLARLDAAIALDPDNLQAQIDRAYIWTLTGQRIEGLATFARIQTRAPAGRALQRRAYWTEGWAMYQLGEFVAAAKAWQQAEKLQGGAPEWAPPTYAVALWSAGDHESALRWYDIAARSSPSQWLTSKGVEASIRYWRNPESAAMRELFAAFQQRASVADGQ